MYQYHDIATAVYRRAIVENPNIPGSDDPDSPVYQLPSWTWAIYVLNFLIFLPLILFVEYTIRQIYPVLAIVENENPPAYEPVSLNDDGASVAEDPENGTPKPAGATIPTGDFSSHTVTSSLRGCHRLLKASGGFRANFRGFYCLLAQGLLTWALMGIFSASLGTGFSSIATLLASLSLVQFSTAWVHIVISLPSQLHFWRRLPSFKRTFEATWKPVTLYWASVEFTRWAPLLVGKVLGLDPEGKGDGIFWKFIVVATIAILSSIFVMIPAHIVLIRVQSSLLPVDEDTIVPFDRSFQGTVEPAVVGGKGYVSMTDAWSTFSRGAWRRIVKLYIKIYAVSFALACFLTLAIAVQVIVLMSVAQKVEEGEGN